MMTESFETKRERLRRGDLSAPNLEKKKGSVQQFNANFRTRILVRYCQFAEAKLSVFTSCTQGEVKNVFICSAVKRHYGAGPLCKKCVIFMIIFLF